MWPWPDQDPIRMGAVQRDSPLGGVEGRRGRLEELRRSREVAKGLIAVREYSDSSHPPLQGIFLPRNGSHEMQALPGADDRCERDCN